jgi:hypothetical protein
MTSAYVTDQIVIEAPDKVGLLADFTTALLGAGVNITSAMGGEAGGEGKIVAITDDNEAAIESLERVGMSPATEQVVVMTMPDEVGALNEAARRVADAGINILWMYATVADTAKVTVVLKTADNDRVAAMF